MTILKLIGCGGEFTDDPTPSPSGNAQSVRDLRQLGGTTWAWHGHQWTPRTDPLTLETSLELISIFRVRRFDPSGLAFIGANAAELDEEPCAAVVPDRCVRYAISSDGLSLVLGGEAHAASVDNGALLLDGERWERVSPMEEGDLRGDYDLAGVYGYRSGLGPSVEGASLSFGDGRFSAVRAPRSAVMLAYELWPDCGAGCRLDGVYTLGRHSALVTTAAGRTQRFFAWVSAGRLQIGDGWYTPR